MSNGSSNNHPHRSNRLDSIPHISSRPFQIVLISEAYHPQPPCANYTPSIRSFTMLSRTTYSSPGWAREAFRSNVCSCLFIIIPRILWIPRQIPPIHSPVVDILQTYNRTWEELCSRRRCLVQLVPTYDDPLNKIAVVSLRCTVNPLNVSAGKQISNSIRSIVYISHGIIRSMEYTLPISTHHHNYRVILASTRIPIIIIIFAILLCTAPLNHKQTPPTQKQSLKLIIGIDHNLHLCALQLIPRLMDHSGRILLPLLSPYVFAHCSGDDQWSGTVSIKAQWYVVGGNGRMYSR